MESWVLEGFPVVVWGSYGNGVWRSMKQCLGELLELKLLEDLWRWVKNFLGLLKSFFL